MKEHSRKRKVAQKYFLYNYRSKNIDVVPEKGVSFEMILRALDQTIYDLDEERESLKPFIEEAEKILFNSLCDVETVEKYPAKKSPKQKKEQHPLENIVKLLHLSIAKKLSIPPVRLQEVVLNGEVAGFFHMNECYMGIDYNRFLCACMTYSILCHESRHAFQSYLSEKFLTHGIIPSDDLDKLLLIFNSFNNYIKGITNRAEIYEKYGFDSLVENYKKIYFKIKYFELPNELDAYIYEIQNLNNLKGKYTHFKTPYSYQYLLLRKYTLLNGLNYHKEGLNHKGIHNCKQVIKSLIYASTKYEAFGKEHKELIDGILRSGFDIDGAFLSLTKKLDSFYDELICFAYNMRAHNIEANFERNGYIDFDKILDPQTETINPNIVKFIPILAQEENPDFDYSVFGYDYEQKGYFEEVLERVLQVEDEDEKLLEKFNI